MGPTTHSWFVLACDHRRPHLAALLDRADDPGPSDADTIVAAKATVADGFAAALATGVDPASAGLLIDEEYGTVAARAALAAGRNVAMPVEASGLDRFALADAGIVERVVAIGPRWVKALVRFNVDGDAAANAESVRALTDLATRLGPTGPGLMLEVLVPPTPEQLATAGDADAFARTHRPALAARAMRALLAAGLEPELWKVEGVDDPDDAAGLADAARVADRPAPLLVLGAGAPRSASITGCGSPPPPRATRGSRSAAVCGGTRSATCSPVAATAPSPSPASPRTSATRWTCIGAPERRRR